jgi:hypothetical protein
MKYNHTQHVNKLYSPTANRHVPAYQKGIRMKKGVLLCCIVAAAWVMLSGCTRAAVDVAAEDETSILFAAITTWPEDTAGGIYGVGTAKPTPSASEPARLTAQAEYGALMRILGEFRKPERLGLQVSQSTFMECIETNIAHVHVKRETLPNNTVKVGIFIARNSIDTFSSCLKPHPGDAP